MQVHTVYNSGNQEAPFSIQALLLALGGPINLYLPNGELTEATLLDVEPLENRILLELIIEIDDHWAFLFEEDPLEWSPFTGALYEGRFAYRGMECG